MKRAILTSVIAASLLASTPAMAGDPTASMVTVATMQRECSAELTSNANITFRAGCLGYLSAARDFAIVRAVTSHDPRRAICVPADIAGHQTAEQERAAALVALNALLSSDPGAPAFPVVVDAISAVFACTERGR